MNTRLLRNVGFLGLVGALVAVRSAMLAAMINCNSNPTCPTGGGSTHAQYYCSWQIDTNGVPGNCATALNTCTQFCDDKGGVSQASGDVSCSDTNGSYGYCYCVGYVDCGLVGDSCYASCNGDPSCTCGCDGGLWDSGQDTCSFSPIMINVADNTSNDQLTSAADGVWFDINADGAAEHIAWTRAGSPVALLTLDRNGNGRIDDGSELFGSVTRKADGTRAANGFDALADLDANGDGQVDGSDPAFAKLMLWIDDNHDGRSQPTELHSLSEFGIRTISTAYREASRTDQFGNVYRFEGTANVLQGASEAVRKAFDVFLVSATRSTR